jgi:NTE family protein
VTVRRGLVFAGGFVAGVAWELGVLRGFEDVNADLLARVIAADVVVGTSAGSTVAAQITGGAALDALYTAQLSGASAEIAVDVDMSELTARFTKVAETAGSAADFRRRIGALGLATQTTVDEATYRASRAARLSGETWPARDVRLVAVDAESGEPKVFTRDSGVALEDAVAASSAFPCIWPAVTIGGHRYMDGAVRSPTNADLATGCAAYWFSRPKQPIRRGHSAALRTRSRRWNLQMCGSSMRMQRRLRHSVRTRYRPPPALPLRKLGAVLA